MHPSSSILVRRAARKGVETAASLEVACTRAEGFRGVKLMNRSGYGFIDFDESSQAVGALEAMQGQPIGEEGKVPRAFF